MPRTKDPEKLLLENLKLRAENKRLKAEARELKGRLRELVGRVEEMNAKQIEVGEVATRTEGLLRWLRARMDVLERELGKE